MVNKSKKIPTFTYSKSVIHTLGKGVKYVQSLTIKETIGRFFSACIVDFEQVFVCFGCQESIFASNKLHYAFSKFQSYRSSLRAMSVTLINKNEPTYSLGHTFIYSSIHLKF